MGIFDWFKKKKIEHLIQENGVCETYSDDGTISSRFNLSNGLLDGKYESYTIHGEVYLTLNFKKGKLHGECSCYSFSRNIMEYIENFKDGVLISRQQCRKIKGYNPNTLLGTNYELGPVIDDQSILKERGSFIIDFNLKEEKYGVIDKLREKGFKFKLLTD